MRVIIMEEGQEASLSFSPPGQILGAVEAKENVRECSKRRRGGEGTAEVRNEHESIVEFGNIEDSVSGTKRQRVVSPTRETVLCLPLQLENCSSEITPTELADELARCLHESKPLLVLDVVKVLGTDRSIELFHRTEETQVNGGLPTADGNKKRAPGGVFLSLVKSSTTAKEKKLIFAREKRIKAFKTRQARGAREKKRQRELEMEFGTGFGVGNFTLELMKANGGGKREVHPEDKNMEKRWNYRKEEGTEDTVNVVENERKPKQDEEEGVEEEEEGEVGEDEIHYSDLDNPTYNERESCKLGEGWRYENESDKEDDFVSQLSEYEKLRKRESRRGAKKKQSSGAESKGAEVNERNAADQFDSTESCDLVGVEIDFNF